MGRLKDMWEAESNGGVPKSVPMLNRLFVGSPGDANTNTNTNTNINTNININTNTNDTRNRQDPHSCVICRDTGRAAVPIERGGVAEDAGGLLGCE